MAVVNETREPAAAMPTAEQCTMMARFYHEGRGCPSDIRRMYKHGWRVFSVQEQHWPLPIDRLRADCPGALTKVPTTELVVFYQRCGHPSENRAKRIVMRFREDPEYPA